VSDQDKPEAPEPIVKVVRWVPTKAEAERIIAEYNRVADDMNDYREEYTVLIDAIRDCQRDLPPVEPPTLREEPQSNRDSRISNLFAANKNLCDRISNLEWALPIHRERIEKLESRLAALESRNATPTPVALPATMDGATEPPKVDCYCWIRTSLGEQLLAVWHSRVRYATDVHDADAKYRPIEIERYWQVVEPKDAVAASQDGWQTEPPTVDCPCWVEMRTGAILAAVWDATDGIANDRFNRSWATHAIKRYYPCPRPASPTQQPPNPIGKAAYNTPTTFEQALTVEPPTPDPVIPLPDGCTEIEGFPLLCKDKEGRDWTRSGYLVLPWGRHEVARMKSRGHSDAEIKQAARYAIEWIARDAGLEVVVK